MKYYSFNVTLQLEIAVSAEDKKQAAKKVFNNLDDSDVIDRIMENIEVDYENGEEIDEDDYHDYYDCCGVRI